MLKVSVEVDSEFLRTWYELSSQREREEALKSFLAPESQIKTEKKTSVNLKTKIVEAVRSFGDSNDPFSQIVTGIVQNITENIQAKKPVPPGETTDSVAVLEHLDRLRLGDDLD